jgi:hypothetical protein
LRPRWRQSGHPTAQNARNREKNVHTPGHPEPPTLAALLRGFVGRPDDTQGFPLVAGGLHYLPGFNAIARHFGILHEFKIENHPGEVSVLRNFDVVKVLLDRRTRAAEKLSEPPIASTRDAVEIDVLFVIDRLHVAALAGEAKRMFELNINVDNCFTFLSMSAARKSFVSCMIAFTSSELLSWRPI